MYQIVWDFIPAPGREADFVRAYGTHGPWIALFRGAAGYLGTELMAMAERPGWYRTIDCWESPAAYDAFRAAFQKEYEAIDQVCAALTSAEFRAV